MPFVASRGYLLKYRSTRDRTEIRRLSGDFPGSVIQVVAWKLWKF